MGNEIYRDTAPAALKMAKQFLRIDARSLFLARGRKCGRDVALFFANFRHRTTPDRRSGNTCDFSAN
jgi:hypothetical protein